MIEAADAVQEFNVLSLAPGSDWETPPHTYQALGPLVRLARHLDQAVEQITFPLESADRVGRAISDDDTDAAQHIARILAAQSRARAAAGAMTKALNDMWSAAGHLGYDTRGLPEYDHDLEGHVHA